MLRCHKLSKRYGSTLALDSVDLALERGKPIALVGPNGAGKTTLLSILCGFVRPSGGEVEVLGCRPGSRALVGRLSALPQDAQLDPRFAINRQLALFARLRGMSANQASRDAQRVLEIVGLTDAAGARPGELSHGMRKRIAIAQALLGTPELVLLDEPTAGLDPENARAIRKLIGEHADTTSFIVSSHNLDELEKLCDSVVHIDRGRVREQIGIRDMANKGYLTIGIQPAHRDSIVAVLEALPGVERVATTGDGNLLLEFDPTRHVRMDVDVVSALADGQLDYRHLIRGRTLEDQLFD